MFSHFWLVDSPQLKRKGARVASLEKQLQEKTSAYSQAALSNTELESQLQVQHTHTHFTGVFQYNNFLTLLTYSLFS